MARKLDSMDLQEQMARLSRQDARGVTDEQTLVTATGTAPAAWVVRIKSLVSYNVYEVEHVTLGPSGTTPALIGGSTMEAVNLAEPFLSNGTLSAGTYAVMWRAEDKNVFSISP